MPSPLIVIVGPTAIGKTALAIRLCQRYAGEIISADSRQIYRRMDIGTAKPTPAEQTAARHHLIDIIEPDQTLGVAEYQSLAYATIEDILRRGRLPFLVGGSGQYVHAVVKGWKVPRVPPDYALRAELEAEARRIGAYALHARLAAFDPQAAARIDYRNVRRVIRALEVCLKTGQPISAQQGAQPPPYRVLQIGLTMPREQLYMRVDARIERMMAEGFLDEVRQLIAQGYHLDLPAMSGLGYRQLGEYLAGHISLEEAVNRIKKETRRFVRQQYNWFRLDDPAIHWVDVGSTDALEAASQLIARFLGSGL
ncbi:MAG: tRNA (adenosine(37)-N6)-dimethylallyltransferase MiaA [Ardenticatenia bacterium]|nr:MAG: tRNA (adenosine(37)-N6)-dimethylallyltransferase MiaA [Ardenticatenia bacterium]